MADESTSGTAAPEGGSAPAAPTLPTKTVQVAMTNAELAEHYSKLHQEDLRSKSEKEAKEAEARRKKQNEDDLNPDVVKPEDWAIEDPEAEQARQRVPASG